VATATSLGLWLLGMQLALTLGLLSGLMTFVPYVGAVVSAAPALLLAVTSGHTQVLYVLGVYVVVHLIEGYVVTPLVEQEAVYLPPALSVAAQITLWTVGGVWGLLLASPIAATALVVIEALHIADPVPESTPRGKAAS
jgi:predicted PurR-regulated permease PerM